MFPGLYGTFTAEGKVIAEQSKTAAKTVVMVPSRNILSVWTWVVRYQLRIISCFPLWNSQKPSPTGNSDFGSILSNIPCQNTYAWHFISPYVNRPSKISASYLHRSSIGHNSGFLILKLGVHGSSSEILNKLQYCSFQNNCISKWKIVNLDVSRGNVWKCPACEADATRPWVAQSGIPEDPETPREKPCRHRWCTFGSLQTFTPQVRLFYKVQKELGGASVYTEELYACYSRLRIILQSQSEFCRDTVSASLWEAW